jgi:class 3 adenylate cyclase
VPIERPETRFAWNGDTALAYQVFGDGELDLLYMPGVLSNVDVMWESERYARFLRRLASIGRLIVSDRRGYGCSERFSPTDVAPLEVSVDDALTVLDEVGSERSLVISFEETNYVAILLAAAHPDRVSHLVLLDPAPTMIRDEEITWEWSPEEWDDQAAFVRWAWGTREGSRVSCERWFASIVDDEREMEWITRFTRSTQGPGASTAELLKHSSMDVRGVLSSITVPTLVLHSPASEGDVRSPRYVADHIQGGAYRELPGRDAFPWGEAWRSVTDEIEHFATGVRPPLEVDRLLATILFTDIVASTERTVELGDAAWRDLLQRHNAIVREELARFGGVEQDVAGDGFFATFDGPARAVECVSTIMDALRPLGLQIRAGVHTGECELIDGKHGGLAVVIGARVSAQAGASEILTTSTVKELVAGSGLVFESAGEHHLKGVPEARTLYRLVQEGNG